MQFNAPTSTEPSVKLFPRLAMAHYSRKPKRITRNDEPPRNAVAGPVSRDAETNHVRSRLLRMILDNERERRNHERPSAG